MEINIRVRRAENGFVVYMNSETTDAPVGMSERLVIAATPEQAVDAVIPRVTEILRNDLGALGA